MIRSARCVGGHGRVGENGERAGRGGRGYGKVGGGDAGRVDGGAGGNWWPDQLDSNKLLADSSSII